MKLPAYEYTTEEQGELFRFESKGPKGTIKKLVVYSKMVGDDLYNLGFGDYDEVTNSIDDRTVTNNRDGPLVLVTVALTLLFLPIIILAAGFILQEVLHQEPDCTK